MDLGPFLDEDTATKEIARLTALVEANAAAAGVERERLIFELGHRVKNTLSVVQAIAGHTLRGAASNHDAMETFAARIVALARANDTILKEGWTTATLGAVAACALQPGGCPLGPLSIEGPCVRIGASGALSFAMALNELASNAARDGAWSRPAGRVDLHWAVEPSPDGDVLALQWIERGGPATQPPAKRGFGLRLIEQSLRAAFGRDVTLTFEPAGFACRLRAKLSDLAGAGLPA